MVVVDLVAGLGAALGWSENVAWGFHQLSIQFSLIVLAFAWLKVPLNREGQLQTWVFRSAALAMMVCWHGGLAHLGWRRSSRTGMDPVDVPHSVVDALCPWHGLGNNQPRMLRLSLPRALAGFHCRHRLIHLRPFVAFGLGMVALACDTWRGSQTNRNGVPCWSVGADCWFGSVAPDGSSAFTR